ncbi:2-hydroxychromene-2-carboxylate isomerase [Bradyrhizobium sp. Tv2a-2]|uniref:2-hydroxychromene-2-carboxylate isomerase n=1 Tax=Bradyrhizobium sp. Tv2a-2 TaxID=113395 RepID=UPI0004641621|nr:2-hydroxychromene-2-carboxylate isomerase [Bradyrhizobium sp. Tv2a-2]
MPIEFVLDYRSPYSYLASTQITKLGAQVHYQPIDIVWVMKKVDNQPSSLDSPKVRYSVVDGVRWAKQYGVPFSPNVKLFDALMQGQVRSDLLSRAGIAGQQLGAFEKVSSALFTVVWGGNSDDLTSEEGRSKFAKSHALPPELWDVANSDDVGEKLATNNERAAARGVFGVPTFFVGDEMFFGNDRLSFVKARLQE